MRKLVTFLAALGIAMLTAGAVDAQWDPGRHANEDVIDFLTVEPEKGEHWSRVWLVVIDGDMYIRLGNRAAKRMERHQDAPHISVRIAGEEFVNVRAEPVPDMAERVAKAMADKYATDFLARMFAHPLTMKLSPDS